MQKLNEGIASGRETTLVSAPAGFGKTTCISAWIYSQDIPVAWLSLDASDDDPGRFFVYLIAALQTVDSRLGKEIEAVIRAGHLPSNEIISTAIINDILKLKRPFLLVLDDFHAIQDNNILEVLKRLLLNHPAPMHLVLISREDPPLPLARLRANNKLTEIRARDLRFSGDDIEAFLNDVMALQLTADNLAVLEEKTEGWIAGLQLVGLSVRDHDHPSEFIARLSGSHRFILGYLTEQVLNQQTDEIRTFLLETSILDSFNSDLCNAVTGRSDSKILLESLLSANLFLVPLDDVNRWYRYHNFFTDLLRELRTRNQSTNSAALHQRASQWYADANMPNEAIQHSLAAKDYPLAAELLEEHAFDLLMRGYAKTIDSWIQAIPAELRLKRPKTNLAFAWAYMLRGAYAELSAYINRGKPPDETAENASLWAEWLVMKSLLLYMQGEFEACLATVEAALEKVPQHDNRVLGLAHYVQAHVHLLKDNYPKAVVIFRKSIQHSREAKSLVPEMMSTISLVGAAVERGMLNQADEIASQAIKQLENSAELPPISAFVYLALGEVYLQWNQIEAAFQVTERAFQLSNLGGLNTGLVYCRLLFSRLFQIKRNLEAAATEIQSAAELLPQEVPEYIRMDVAAQQVRLFLDQNQLNSAEAVLERHQSFFDRLKASPGSLLDHTNPFSGGMFYNCLLRMMLRRDEGKTNLLAGREMAARIFAEADRKEQFLIALEALLLRAQFSEKLGEPRASWADITQALQRGQREGIVGVFVEQGMPLAAMLQNLLETGTPGAAQEAYVRKILDAFPQTHRGDPVVPALIDPLTDRELDVLILLVKGLKYKEIAAKLFVSLNTVRSHVKAIYGKLNVTNRAQAIDKARKLHIL